MSKPEIRASSMPQYMSCANSLVNPDGLVEVETENPASKVGHLLHEAASALVTKGTYDLDAMRDQLETEDFTRAYALFQNLRPVVDEFRKYSKAPKSEVGLAFETKYLKLTGHIDLMERMPKVAYLLDFKSGRTREDYYHQMITYAWLVWNDAGRPKVYTVHVTVVYLEDNTIRQYVFTAAAMQSWEDAVDVQYENRQYVTGRHCSFCTLQDSCPALKVYGRASLHVLSTSPTLSDPKVWRTMPESERKDTLDRAYVIGRMIDRLKDSLRGEVRRNGPLAVGDGDEYRVIEEKGRALDAAKSWDILTRVLGLPALVRLARLTLGDVMASVSRRAAKGRKLRAQDELETELRQVGAIIDYKQEKMFKRPIKESVMEPKQ